MPKLLSATIVVAVLLLSALPAVAGDKAQGAADRQQAIDHSREVHRMKEHTRQQERKIREQAEEDREKIKEKADDEGDEKADIEEENEG